MHYTCNTHLFTPMYHNIVMCSCSLCSTSDRRSSAQHTSPLRIKTHNHTQPSWGHSKARSIKEAAAQHPPGKKNRGKNAPCIRRINCTWLRVVQLHFLLMHGLCNYFPNCTRIHVITYINSCQMTENILGVRVNTPKALE